METKVILCDKCKQKVAKSVCRICEADVCDSCFSDVPFNFAYNNGTFTSIIICNKCKKAIEQMVTANEHDKNSYEEIIVKYLKDNLVLEELQSDDNEKTKAKKK
jgi:hypothetical protein